ncbi:MAG: Putative aspartate/glutamate/hydantoin racemase [Synergistales bacterium 57_84]|nr:MAG: Putative aspartate/glutamate/hydantoin racemase [Synergistales bacterium 57_84]
MIDPSEPFKQVIPVVASDRCGRSLPRLCSPARFYEASALLEASFRPVIVTGFYVPSAGAPESDGPAGAAVLARAMKLAGRQLIVATDRWNERAVKACCQVMEVDEVLVTDEGSSVLDKRPDLVVFVERLGRACDGRYYNMRGEERWPCLWTYPTGEPTPWPACCRAGSVNGLGILLKRSGPCSRPWSPPAPSTA